MSLNVKPTGSVDRPLLPVVLCTALVLVTYVSPIATVAETSADLGAGAGARAWILSSMSVGLAAALLTSGAIGDRRGRRRTYLAGLGLLGVGALVCAGAQEPVLFVLARVAQGVGGAAVLACGLAALAHAHAEPRARSHATALWGAAVGSGIGAGSVAAAALDEVGDWRLVYVVAALAAIVLVPLSRVRMAESAAAAPRASDPLGLVLLVMTLSLAVAALTEARRGLTVIVIVLLISSAVSATALVLVERRVPAPLLEPELMTHRRFRAAALGSFVLGLSMIGLASFVPTVALVGLGRGLWSSTWLVVVWAGVSVAASLLLRYVPWPMEGSGPVAGALVLVAGGQLVAHGLDVDSGPARLALAMAAAGVGTGLLNAMLGREAVASVAPDRAAMGSGANNTCRYLGAACGITLFVTIATHDGLAPAQLVQGWNHAVVSAVAITLLGALAVLVAGREPRSAHSAVVRPAR